MGGRGLEVVWLPSRWQVNKGTANSTRWAEEGRV